MLSSLRHVAFQCAVPTGRTLLTKPPPVLRNHFSFRHTKTSSFRKAETRSIKERLLAPAGETAFTVGKGVVAGSSIFGLGALCYYGLGLSKEVGAFERSLLWPDYVKTRIRETYGYFGLSILAVAGSAAASFRNPVVMRFVASNSIVALVGLVGSAMAASVVTHSLPYTEGFGVKQLAWLAHCGIIGATLAPIAFLGGPILLKAGLYTAGICGGLSILAICAPSEKFLTMAGPLSIGLGLVFASTLGSMFLPATTVLGSGLHSIMLYGGLVVFSGTLLFHTQHAVKQAEVSPHYDPINQSMGIYMSVLNIFIRMVMILSGGGSSKRR